MSDLDRNPYAPPAAEPPAGRNEEDPFAGDGEASNYESERRPVILCIGLTIITLGFYPSIWLLQRRPFLDRLNASKELGTLLPILSLVAGALGIALAFGGKDTASIRPLVQLVGGISTLIANFRVLNILRSDSARTGRFLEFSTIGTFFFGVYYLQYKMNQLADTPARVGAPRRKKKRKKPVEAAAPSEAPPAA
ncbi:MAG TPA: DUF4234 domain-containing protein [Labilithrix sp.]|nr:DUF4234 domain-containing protein [Labilithrix sp.]